MALISSTPSLTSANRVRTAVFAPAQTLAGKAAVCVAASLFVAVCAHVSVPLPFTPVPLTLGNMAVVLVGLALGPSAAFAAMLMYLAEGALGLPVFNPGGLGGTAQLLGPTGGFLFAYPFAAALAGGLYRTLSSRIARFSAAATSAALATALVLAVGVTWLSSLLHLAPVTAFKLGLAPFIPGEVIKVAAAAGIFASLARWRQHKQ